MRNPANVFTVEGLQEFKHIVWLLDRSLWELADFSDDLDLPETFISDLKKVSDFLNTNVAEGPFE